MDLKTLKALKPTEYATAADGYRTMSSMADAARESIDKQIILTMRKANEGEAANAALTQLQKLSDNFHYTQVECGLAHGALSGFSAEIAAPLRRLNEALEDAASLAYSVGADGSVAYPAGGKNALTGDPIPGGTITGNNGLYSRGLGTDTSGLLNPNPHHAKAQDIADRVAHALREATEIDDRYGKALEKLKAAPGLTVDNKTWGDAESDASAIRSAAAENLKEAIPADKSPADRKAWWDSLQPEQKEEYLAVYPDVIGNLDGIPASVRDEANRENIQLLIGKLSEQHDDKSRTMLDGLKSIDYQLRNQDPDFPPMYLLGIGDEGGGRAIVSYGNPDTSKNVSAYVPGLGTSVDADFARNDLKRARDTAKDAQFYDPSTASIVWLGYDAPQMPASDFTKNADVMSTDDAKAGATAYNKFMSGISATNENSDPHITAIGHSYGSLTVGQAAQQHGGIPGADDIILVGSPGTGAHHATDLNVEKGHVFVGAAENDPVTKLPNHNEAGGLLTGAVGGGSAGLVLGGGMAGPVGAVVGGVSGAVVGGIAGYEAQDAQTDPDEIWFGTDPASKDFGAQRFRVDDGPRPFVDGQGPTPAHSNYFNPEKDMESAKNIALIVAGHSNEIQLEQPR
ncbi:alpha/beta hydrolase [Streptomyces niveiscabiei]|uniref:alpha/beta hydrolase n=1 Tax=Streptomyces niveiscabiei TaxID=164115 RepID=UPI0029AD30EB|nr:alpha/beta hydrolase [Streptomyces niveiscabiei]MDX3385693.1 alpha/beta hydrolase [Streptomyces niveiscabiei]